MPRCSATTATGRRCRCSAVTASTSTVCATHARHPPATDHIAADIAASYAGDVNRGFARFWMRYYDTLCDLYNVAPSDMEAEYREYRRVGRRAYDAYYSRSASASAVAATRPFDAFCQRYYETLRELYNVAGDEMEDEFAVYRRLGRKAYEADHMRRHPGFRMLLQTTGA
jgi:hypothetical protein